MASWRTVVGWAIPLIGAASTGGTAALAVFLAGPGCQIRCERQLDCPAGTFCVSGRCDAECFSDEDCRNPPECADNPLGCKPRGYWCDTSGHCLKGTGGVAPPRVDVDEAPAPDRPDDVEGWQDPPGIGRAFIVNSLAIARQDVGFDIDGECRGPGDCVDNSLHQLGSLGNDQIRQGLLGGETLLLIELAGLDPEFRGNDPTLTVKFYGARDADDPFFPANNFQTPVGDAVCCEFKINPQSMSGVPPQAKARAPAKIERGQMKSLVPVPIQFTLTVGVPPHPEIRIEKVSLSARVPVSLGSMTDGILGGAVPINTLAQTENPYCKTLNNLCPKQIPDSKLIDLIATILSPDIDLDVPPDGKERLQAGANGRIETCFDGNRACPGGCTEPKIVEPLTADEPWTCALSPEMADGYSVGITFAAVAASIVGVGQ